MEQQPLCPNCGDATFACGESETAPPVAWRCESCGYTAQQDQVQKYTCWLCNEKTMIHLKDENEDYWWCLNCGKRGLDPDFAYRLDAMTRQDKQVYAAKCLKCYCGAKGIKHKSIDKLEAHLHAIRMHKNLAEWEQLGAYLDLAGRGAPVPPQLQKKIPNAVRGEFAKLVENCVEVGRSDLEGPPTGWPAHHLKVCIEILQSSNVQLPTI